MGWAFWDVNGGFHTVQSKEVLARMARWHPLWCGSQWLEQFMSQRALEVA